MVSRLVNAHVSVTLPVTLLALVLVSACASDGASGDSNGGRASNSGAGSGGRGASGGTPSAGGTNATAGSTAGGGPSTSGSGGAVISLGGAGSAGGTGAAGMSSGGNPGGGQPGGGGSSGDSSVVPMHPGQCIYPPTASERKAPAFTLPAPAAPAGLVLRLMNNCPQTLWVHANGIPGGVVELAGKQAGQPPMEKVYDWPGLAGRMSVNEGSENGFNVNFLEMNANKQALNVNLSNVDWVGLPVEVKGNDPSKCLTGCYTPLAHMMDGCPPQLLDAAHQVCQAPKDWCANGANANDALCTALDAAGAAVIANDPKCKAGGSISAAGTGWKIYGCAGNGTESFWNQNPYCCAEVNRGYSSDVNDPGSDATQNCNYYKSAPFSTYSAYSQHVCPYVYSFAYDDVNNQSGFAPCQGATEMDVTWCPGDP